MKRKLNLNEPSARIMAGIGLFLVAIPVVLTVSGFLLRAANIQIDMLDDLRNGSFAIGLILGAGFIVLIVVEQIQDQRMDAAYRRNRSQKLPLPGGGYECQYCGNRKIRAHDTCCPVCGQTLR
jgi:hypothetical protein